MKPAFSIVFFTVSSGAGLGLLALLALTDLLLGGAFEPGLALAGGLALGLVLVAAGLLSSTLHLANPRNAWRALSRVGTSWLSREAVSAIALLTVSAIYLLVAGWGGGVPSLRVGLALATVPLAWATLYATAMIYASLKPIRQWHTPLTPINYLTHGHASGALLWLGVLYWAGHDAPWLAWIVLALLAASFAAKLAYLGGVVAGDAGSVSIERAIGTSRMRARLFDLGHTHGTFLTDEFHFSLARRHTMLLLALLFVFAYAVPALWLLAGTPTVAGALLAFAASALGYVCERWLFFAQARHTVRLYHGDLRT